MTDFFRTKMGFKYFEKTLPEIATNLHIIAHQIKRFNNLKERELQLKERELEILK